MKTKIIIGLLGVIFLIGGGFFVGSAQGFDAIYQIFSKPQLITPPSPGSKALDVVGCDQGATTTPCSVLQALQAKAPQQPAQPAQSQGRVYGPLTNTYTDAKYGFSLKYPDELTVINGGDVELVDRNNEKLFSLKVCNPDSPCGRGFTAAAIKSLDEVRKAYVDNTYADSGTQYKEEFHPVTNLPMQAASGAQILKQAYSVVIRDPNGSDVTAEECPDCTAQRVRYVLFKSQGNYLIIQPTDTHQDQFLEDKIIHSITY
jgi:hypothetical protein